MKIIPAIDLLDQTAVRLTRGDYNTEKKVAEDPIQTALSFAEAGAEELHLVDLNGAKAGKPYHTTLFAKIIQACRIPCEIGGGLRALADIESAFAAGATRAILGSAALKEPELVRQALAAYGDRIAIGIDAVNGMVSTEGWLSVSQTNYLDFAKEMTLLGARFLIFTDISRDGTLAGANLDALDALCNAVSCNVIASGGIRDISDIRALKKLPLYGAICGKSLYAGTLSLSDAIREALC